VAEFRIIWVGRHRKQTPEQAIIDRFKSRLAAHFNIIDHVLRPGEGSPEAARKEETDRLLQQWRPQNLSVFLDETGQSMDSPAFARLLQRQALEQSRAVDFYIGGAFGFDAARIPASGIRLSLSKMTFPHALARIVLYEQIYRAFCILQGHPYHHGAHS
jgi:23S rRNA (pseudouridine1915-N3)-methyltransferase